MAPKAEKALQNSMLCFVVPVYTTQPLSDAQVNVISYFLWN
jgi:hypothetical protein